MTSTQSERDNLTDAERFNELRDAVLEFIGVAWTGTDEQGRATYVSPRATTLRLLKAANLTPDE